MAKYFLEFKGRCMKLVDPYFFHPLFCKLQGAAYKAGNLVAYKATHLEILVARSFENKFE